MNIAQPLGTAALGKPMLLLALSLQGGAVSTANAEGLQLIPSMRAGALAETRRTASRERFAFQGTQSVVRSSAPSFAESDNAVLRQTTTSEKLLGEFRSWRLLTANWDGEGAEQPSDPSLKQAELFTRLYGFSARIPEAMLNANGHAGLFWNESGLYADIEFLGDDRLAYYIERNGDKHKGVTKFNSEQVPAVLEVLLSA